MIAAFFH